MLTTVMILAQNLASLIDFCVFALWIFYVVSMILVLILRKIRPDAHRPYKVSYGALFSYTRTAMR